MRVNDMQPVKRIKEVLMFHTRNMYMKKNKDFSINFSDEVISIILIHFNPFHYILYKTSIMASTLLKL